MNKGAPVDKCTSGISGQVEPVEQADNRTTTGLSSSPTFFSNNSSNRRAPVHPGPVVTPPVIFHKPESDPITDRKQRIRAAVREHYKRRKAAADKCYQQEGDHPPVTVTKLVIRGR